MRDGVPKMQILAPAMTTIVDFLFWLAFAVFFFYVKNYFLSS
jgi:hypothetical protein